MSRTRTLSALSALVAFAAACGGAATEDDMGEAQAMVMDVEAPECYLARGTVEEAEARVSPLSRTEFTLSGAPALLCYGAPSANGRQIMDSLFVYGSPERIGANEPTTLHLTAPAIVGDVALEAGSYTIYAIGTADEWEIFINPNYQRWGVPISDEVRATEIGSFMATPMATDGMVETMNYRWEPTDETMGNLIFEWENTAVAIHVMAGG